MSIYEDFMKGQQAPQPTGGSIYERFMAQQNPVQEQQAEPQEKGFFSTALDYLDKPASAVAGAVEYMSGVSDDQNILDAVTRGARENADYKRVLAANDIDPESWQGQALNIAGKAILDPLWVVTPAKVVAGAKSAAKAAGVADDIARAGRAVKESSIGQAITNTAREIGEKEVGGLSLKRWISEESPIQSQLDDLQRAQQNSADTIRQGSQKIEELKKINPNLGEEVTRMQEARVSAEQAADGISDLTKQQVFDDIAQRYSPETATKVRETVDFINDINNQGTQGLLQRGIISQETADKFADRYIRREYSKYVSPEEHLRMLQETGQLQEAAAFEKGMNAIQRQAAGKYKLPLDKIKQRQDLPPEVQERLGRLMDATHPFAKGGKITSDLINRYDFLQNVAENYASDVAQIGYKLVEGKKFGPLSGKYLPREVANEINRVVPQMTDPESWWRKGVAYWKMGKTVLNPATFMRNNMSNVVLLNVAGVPLWDIPEAAFKAATELRNPGKYTALAKRAGTFLSDTMTEAELRKFLQQSGNQTLIGKGIDMVKAGTEKAANLYQGGEKLGKLAAFIWGVEKKGMTPEAAAKFADEALFNYSKVPPIIDSLRRSGLVPFATFPYKATKMTAKAMYNNPAKVRKYFVPMQETQNPDETAILPDYLNPETLMPLGRGQRTVDGKQQNVNNYLDLKSILPFQSADQVGLSPALSIYSALKNNVDPTTGREIARDGMTPNQKRSEMGKYLWQQLSPAFPLIPGTYGYDKLVNQALLGKPDYKGRQFGMGEAVAHTVLGLRNVPISTPEVARQRMSQIDNEIRSTQIELRRMLSDRRLQEQDKKQITEQYKRQIIELGKERKRVAEAYGRLKKKEGR